MFNASIIFTSQLILLKNYKPLNIEKEKGGGQRRNRGWANEEDKKE